MDLISRMEGYTNQQISHNDPISHKPTPKTLHDKKDTTLLEIALKGFLRQRLYGKFQNFQKDNIYNKNHLELLHLRSATRGQYSSSIDFTNSEINQSHNSIYNEKQSKVSKYGSRLEKYNNSIKIPNLQKISNSLFVRQNKISSLQSSLDLRKQTNSIKKNALTVRKIHQINPEEIVHQNNHTSRQLEFNSFISEVNYGASKNHPDQIILKNDLKLPSISGKNAKLDHRHIKKTKNSLTYRSMAEQQTILQISDQFWKILSSKSEQKQKIIKDQEQLSYESKKQQIVRKGNNSLMKMHSIQNIQKNNKFDQNAITIKKQTKKFQQSILNKQTFNRIFKNENFSIVQFVNSIFSFFDFSNKFKDKIKRIDFQTIIQDCFNTADRLWCVAIFRYIDIGHQGKIYSNQLFKIYNYIDNLRTKASQRKNEINKLKDTQQSHCGKSQIIKNVSNLKKQTIELSESIRIQNTQQNQQYLTEKKQRKNLQSHRKNTNSSQAFTVYQTGLLNSKYLLSMNRGNIDKFEMYIQRLNNILIEKTKLSNASQFINLQTNQQANIHALDNEQIKQQILLQEVLLRQPRLTSNDLLLISNQSEKNNINKKKKIIDIDYKKLNLKLSSAYTQTFSAMDHNQSTRINRQFIQKLKEILKRQNQQLKLSINEQHKNSLSMINYREFYEQKLYLPFKLLFFDLIHAKLPDSLRVS